MESRARPPASALLATAVVLMEGRVPSRPLDVPATPLAEVELGPPSSRAYPLSIGAGGDSGGACGGAG